jgi:hypothetical protein
MEMISGCPFDQGELPGIGITAQSHPRNGPARHPPPPRAAAQRRKHSERAVGALLRPLRPSRTGTRTETSGRSPRQRGPRRWPRPSPAYPIPPAAMASPRPGISPPKSPPPPVSEPTTPASSFWNRKTRVILNKELRVVVSSGSVMRSAQEDFRHYPMFRHRSATPAGLTGNGVVPSLGNNGASILRSAENARADSATARITAVGSQQSGTGSTHLKCRSRS